MLCVSLFGNVLCWLAFGLGRHAYLSVERGGGKPESGTPWRRELRPEIAE